MVGLVIANAKFTENDRGGTDAAAWMVVVFNGVFMLALGAGLFTKYASDGIRMGRRLLVGSDGSDQSLLN